MSTNDTVWAVSDKVMAIGEDLIFGWNFSRILAATETLTGVPTVTADAAGISIETPAVNGSAFDDDSLPPVEVAIGKGVQVRIHGATEKRTYELTCLCPTSTGRIRGGRARLIIQ